MGNKIILKMMFLRELLKKLLGMRRKQSSRDLKMK